MYPLRTSLLLLAGLVALLLTAKPVVADELVSQLASGEALYNAQCASCHAMNLRGSAHGVALKGSAFLEKWTDRNSTALLRHNQSRMPPGGADALGGHCPGAFRMPPVG